MDCVSECCSFPIISMDIGSGSIKCGFSGDDCPLFDIPSLFGRTIHHSNFSYQSTQEAKPDNPDERFCGEEALLQKSYLSLQYFIENGIVTNWDNLECALYRVFYDKMKVESYNHPLILNSMPLNPKSNKEKMTQICFETFNVPAVYFSNPAQMALLASGRTFGISLLCGDGVSLTTAFLDDGTNNDLFVNRMNVGGRDLSDYLLKLVMGRGKCSLPPLIGREVMREIKESGFFTCKNHHNPTLKKYFTLPNGSRIELEEELEECAEPLFRTDLVSSSLQFSGLHEMTHHCIANVPIEYRKHLYSNIVLAGGSTLFNGFKNRLESELKSLTNLPISIQEPENRKHTIWIGQSIFSSLSSFEPLLLTKDQYDESGPCIIRRRVYWW